MRFTKGEKGLTFFVFERDSFFYNLSGVDFRRIFYANSLEIVKATSLIAMVLFRVEMFYWVVLIGEFKFSSELIEGI